MKMKKHFARPCMAIFILLILFSCSDNSDKKQTKKSSKLYTFTITSNQDTQTQKLKSDIFTEAIFFKPTSSEINLTLKEANSAPWAAAKYLVVDVYSEYERAVVMFINFFSDTTVATSHFNVKIGLLPYLKTQVIFPLDHLDAERVYLPRFPRQLKGTCSGRRIAPEDIKKVTITLDNIQLPDFAPNIYISSAYLSAELPAPLPKLEKPVVDKFGQWTAKEWKGKTKSDDELRKVILEEEAMLDTLKQPTHLSQYGGWKNKKFKATGFFRTEFDGKRWWFVDPDGYAMLSNGVDCIRSNVETPIELDRDLFEWLPAENDSIFKDVVYLSKRKQLCADFFKANLIRVYGKEWKEKWAAITTKRLHQYQFNTIGNWSSAEYIKQAKMPYVFPMTNFPETATMIYRDFPDVFNPAYRDSSVKFAAQLQDLKDDKYMIGYFLRNEPLWGFTDGSLNLAFEMMSTDKASVTKQKFIEWLTQKYQNDVKLFADTWQIKVSSFEDLHKTTIKNIKDVSATAANDMYAFSEMMVREYVRVPCEEVKKIDKHHLNLGMRYAWISTPLLYNAGEFFDVYSINGYNSPAPPPTDEIYKKSGKPVLIGEFHHGATDRGLPANGIQGAFDQTERGIAFRYYTENGFARPEVIGLHYFLWNDQPITGRFDGENYNVGLIDICNRPYTELVEAMTETNKRIYDVATQKVKPYSQIVKKVPQIFY
jgi:hypothetical protein